MKILTEATPLALWYAALHEAQAERRIILKTDIESYLVFLLMRYINKPELASEIMTVNFLEGMQSPSSRQRILALQKVGDQCLILTGLFPLVVEKRNVKLRYFIELGQVAYEVVSRKNNDIFSLLSDQFVIAMNVLQSFRPKAAVLLPATIRKDKGKIIPQE